MIGRHSVLAFADDELMMGHRHSEWLVTSPFLEEDLAFASIAQDELGHARALYELLTDDVDGLAFGREPDAYRSCWLVELPCERWEGALVRHYLYDTAEELRWQSAAESSNGKLAGVAAKALREERYHRDHARALIVRMLGGTEESRSRIIGELERLWPLAHGIFEPMPDEHEALADGVLTTSSEDLEAEWTRLVAVDLSPAGFVAPPKPAATGSMRTERSPHFDELFATMTAVLALDPEAQW